MTRPTLAESNELTRLDSGVWAEADEAARSAIDYTDGDAREAEVRRVIEQARDLSSDSPELDRAWEEWALEYHLTSLRSNLLRGLDLGGARRVLEVGCGCGAITRYLGDLGREQGFRVDAIEGSMQRAEIARLRCRGLDNVNIVCSNYNDLALPKGKYDLILFIGVLEYSGLYAPEGVAPDEQLVATLRAARWALAPDGAILIAVENRLGFKYLAGAREDHLGKPHLGVRGYPEVPGETEPRTRNIRTWSLPEWAGLLGRAGIPARRFAFPFPDYKLPEVLLSEGFVEGNPWAFSPLHGTGSRDYLGDWQPEIDEAMFWKAAAEGGFLSEAANSFLIAAGSDPERVERLLPIDFIRFSGRRRKPRYRLNVVKPAGGEKVIRRPQAAAAGAIDAPEGKAVAVHRIRETPYVAGELLSEVWVETLKSYCEEDVWAALLQQYHGHLVQRFATAGNPRSLLDALPSNIVVEAQTGEWRLVDLEWEAREEISPDFVFFRAVLQFALWNRERLRFVREIEEVQLVGDLLGLSFGMVGRDFDRCALECIELENRFQRQVIDSRHLRPVEELLRLRLYEIEEPERPSTTPETLFIPFEPGQATIYWAPSKALFTVEDSLAVDVQGGANGEVVEVTLPSRAAACRYLRIDPSNELLAACNSLFEFQGLAVEVVSDSETRKVLEIDSLEELLDRADLVDLARVEDARGALLLVESYDPQIIMDLGEGWGGDAEEVVVRFTLRWPYGDDYLRVRRLLASEDELLARRVWERRAQIKDLERAQGQLERRAEEAKRQLGEMEKSVAWRSWSRLRRLLDR